MNRNRSIHLAVLIVLIVAVYSSAVQNGLGIDDKTVLLGNPAIYGMSLSNIRVLFTSLPNDVEYLPVRDLTYVIDYELWGPPMSGGRLRTAIRGIYGYHLSNIFYYAAACVALYLFLERLLRRWTGQARAVAFFSALLYAVHPMHVESVAGIAHRKDLVSGLFVFLCLWSYVAYRESKRNRYYIFSLMATALALLSKTTALVLPLLMLLIEYVCLRERREGVFRPAIRVLPFAVLTAATAFLSYSIAGSVGLVLPERGGLLERLPSAAKAAAVYVKMLVMPYPLSIWHDFESPAGLLDPVFLLSLAVVLGIIFLAFWNRRRSPVVSFCTGWFLVSVIPVIGLIPTSTVIAERYLFLPSVGFCAALAWGIQGGLYIRWRNAAISVLVIVVLVFSVISFKRNFDWKDNLTILRTDLKKSPDSYRLNQMMGRLYFLRGYHAEGLTYLLRGKQIRPYGMDYDFFQAYYLNLKGRHGEALPYLRAINDRYGGTVVDVNCLMGIVYEAMGEYELAGESYLRAVNGKMTIGVFMKRDARAALDRLKGMK
jgi:hypothetical protein